VFKVKFVDILGDKRKVKIRFEDGPHPGLEDYVPPRQLLTPWGQRQGLLRDEEREARLTQHAREKNWDQALVEAASAILESTGEPGASADARRVRSIPRGVAT
jgi:hypothetical protein